MRRGKPCSGSRKRPFCFKTSPKPYHRLLNPTYVPRDDHAQGEAVVRQQEAPVLLEGEHHVAARVHRGAVAERGAVGAVSLL